jgi:hypothetical protein
VGGALRYPCDNRAWPAATSVMNVRTMTYRLPSPALLLPLLSKPPKGRAGPARDVGSCAMTICAYTNEITTLKVSIGHSITTLDKSSSSRCLPTRLRPICALTMLPVGSGYMSNGKVICRGFEAVVLFVECLYNNSLLKLVDEMTKIVRIRSEYCGTELERN